MALANKKKRHMHISVEQTTELRNKPPHLLSIQFSSVAQLSPALFDLMDCSTPGFLMQHQLLEFAQIHVHWVGDALPQSHSMSSPSPPAFNLAQNQIFPKNEFFASGDESIGVSASTSVLPMNIQDWFPLGLTGLISLQSKGLSRVLQHHSSKASILQHSAFFMVQLLHLYMTTRKTTALIRWTLLAK